MYYRSRITGNYIKDSDLDIFDRIYGKDLPAEAVHIQWDLEPVESPDVLDCILHGSDIMGVSRYRELHEGCTLKEAWNMVRAIKRDYKKVHKQIEE